MRILLEHGSHSFDNLGDVAMLQVAARRVRELWPEAEICAVTLHPDRLARHLPGIVPGAPNIPAWSLPFARAASRLPHGLRAVLANCLTAFRSRGGAAPSSGQKSGSMASADLVLMSGSGIFADPFQGPALRRLETLAAAGRAGVPFAFMSQGLGPMNQRPLRDRAREVFGGAILITLRERLHGPDLLKNVGVPDDRVMVASDDSLELALESHQPDAPREALGFNLRLASHSGLPESATGELGKIVEGIHEFARREAAALRPLSVHRYDHARLLRKFPELHSRHLGLNHQHTVDALLQAISHCRVVVTGTYHAAVLALGQGIPTLCLANNRYYRLKFNGLVDQFPQGCVVIDLDRAGAAAEVNHRLDDLWHRADELQDSLLATTEVQVERSREAYLRLRVLV